MASRAAKAANKKQETSDSKSRSRSKSKSKRRTADCVQAVRLAVGKVFSCSNLYKSSFDLPYGAGEQLSITGFSLAFGNGGGFFPELNNVMKSFPAMRGYSGKTIDRLARRRAFIVQCGDCDVHLVLLGVLSEILKSGAMKIIVASDSAEERAAVFDSLTMMRAELSGAAVELFKADKLEKAENTVYGFLTSEQPEILVMGQASFTREYNFLRRSELSEHISKARPVIVTISETTSSARSIAKSSVIFSPCALVSVVSEVKRLRDAVIFRPADLEPSKAAKKSRSDEPLQLSL